MDWREIERTMKDAGWELDGGFSEHLVIGEYHNLSILAYPRAWEAGDPLFELCDGERELACWVGEVPTPQRATELLEDHGKPPEDEWGDPYQEEVGGNGEGELYRSGA